MNRQDSSTGKSARSSNRSSRHSQRSQSEIMTISPKFVKKLVAEPVIEEVASAESQFPSTFMRSKRSKVDKPIIFESI